MGSYPFVCRGLDGSSSETDISSGCEGASTGKSRAPGAPCRFWRTDAGCKKGDACGFIHDWSGISKTNRCGACSAPGHTKRECPTLKKTEKPGKVAKVKGSPQGVPADAASSQTTTSTAAKSSSSSILPGSVEDATWDDGEGSGKTVLPQKPAKGVQEDDPTAALLREATGLLKSVSSLKAVKISRVASEEDESSSGLVALLDGGATRALRQATLGELLRLRPVEVELAKGTATLYQVPKLDTLLSI